MKKLIINTLALVFIFQVSIYAVVEGQQSLHDSVPSDIGRLKLQPTGRLDSTTVLSLAISLPLRNQQALNDFLKQVYDPSSSNFHHYLTVQEFTQEFGPASQDYKSLVEFAKANGLIVMGTSPNNMILDVKASVAKIERAFHIKMFTYKHPRENRTFFAPDRDPSLSFAVPVSGISGLTNYSLPHPNYRLAPIVKRGNLTPNSGSGPGGSYMGYDFRSAYTPSVSLTGSGQSVGLLQYDGYLASDITAYENASGLPHVTLTNVLIDGFNGSPTSTDGQTEVSLDIEMAISMAPGLSSVIIYEAGPYGLWHDILNRMATDNLAKQLSCS